MIITREFIMRGASKNGGWSVQQLDVLGTTFVKNKGWLDRLIGNEITEAQALKFLRLKDAHLKMCNLDETVDMFNK